MADLPAAGYITSNARTEQEVKDELEAIIATIKQMPGAPVGSQTLQINNGAITPSESLLVVDTQSLASTDNLDTINTTNMPDGSIVLIRSSVSTREIVIRHGVGNIQTIGSQSWSITNNTDWFLFVLNSTSWRMVNWVRRDLADLRTDLGLGTAATQNEGSGNGLDADTLDGQHAAAFLGASAQAADSAQLVGAAGANYMRKDAAAGLQTISPQVTIDDVLTVRDNTSSSPTFRLAAGGANRGLINWFSDVLEVSSWNSTGSARVGGLRARRNSQRPQHYHEGNAGWEDLATLEDAEYLRPNEWFLTWDKSLPTTYVTAENVVAAKYQIGVGDGVAGTKWFRIRGQMGLAPAGQGSGWNLGLRVTAGPNGNDTDTFIFEGTQRSDFSQNGVYASFPVNWAAGWGERQNPVAGFFRETSGTNNLPFYDEEEMYATPEEAHSGGQLNPLIRYQHEKLPHPDEVMFQANAGDYITFYMRTSTGATGANIGCRGTFLVQQLSTLTDVS